MSDRVGNPKDRFSHNQAHIMIAITGFDPPTALYLCLNRLSFLFQIFPLMMFLLEVIQFNLKHWNTYMKDGIVANQ